MSEEPGASSTTGENKPPSAPSPPPPQAFASDSGQQGLPHQDTSEPQKPPAASAPSDDAVAEITEEFKKTMDFSFNFPQDEDDSDDSDDSDDDDDDDDDDDSGSGSGSGGPGGRGRMGRRNRAGAGNANNANANANDDEEELIDEMEMMPSYMLSRVEHLRSLNTQRDEIMGEYLKERAVLEQKFQHKCSPLYQRRKDVIAGRLDDYIEKDAQEKEKKRKELDGIASPPPPPDDGGEGEDGTANGGGEGAAAPPPNKEPGIPQFWVCAMSHLEPVAELITESDVDCLEHVTDVTCTDHIDGKGFTLSFHFEPNDYFTNSTLTKEYQIPNLLLEDEPILKVVAGCEIDWKSNKCLTHRQVQKRQRAKSGKNAGKVRTVTKMERRDSFFHFFSPPQMPTEVEEMDEEVAEALEEAFDHDYDVAQAFRNHLIPRALLWFTGEALEEGMGDDDDDEE